MTRLRHAVLLSLLLATALVVAACGGGDSDEAASPSTDVDELLTQTFTGSKEVKSGKLELSMKLDAQGSSQLDGPVSIRLSGPFQAQDGGKLPEFKLDAAFEGAGQSIEAGATSTGEKGFISFQGTDYVVENQVFQQFKAGFEQAQKQATDGKQAQSFASLGMDPRKWLTNPKNEGEAKVGDDDTIKITGGVDVAKLLDDVNLALEKASSLGLQGAGQVPERLTDAQRRQVIEAVKDPRVEIYTGKEDTILRRMVVNLGVEDGGTSGTVAFDIAISDLNEDQDIAEPADAKPFDQLLGQLGGLGALGAGGSSAPGGASPGSAADLDEYSKCLTDAGSDADKARECADLLSG
ncbi:MAG: hypothetical protein ACR2L8_12615 [Solirubrobacteraceae bacterium]